MFLKFHMFCDLIVYVSILQFFTMRSKFLIACLFSFGEIYAASFMKSYGGSRFDVGYSVIQTPDSGYVMAGLYSRSSPDSGEVLILSVDKHGNVRWRRIYGLGNSEQRAFSIKRTSDGGYIVLARTRSSTTRWDILLIKTDSVGNLVWSRVYGTNLDDDPSYVIQTTDGGYLVVGGAQSRSSSSQNEILVLKVSSTGSLEWVRWLGDTIYHDQAYSVKQTSDGGYIITGRTGSYGPGSPGNANIFLIKLNSNGNLSWAKAYGNTYADFGYDLQITSDGGYVVAGYYTGPTSGDTNSTIFKTDSMGNLQWYRILGGTNTDIFYSVWQTLDGGYVAVGLTRSFGAGGADVFLTRFSSIGNLHWSKAYGGTGQEHGSDIQQSLDGGFVIVGRTNTSSFSSGSYDLLLIKTNSLGNVGSCTHVYNINPDTLTATLDVVSFTPRVFNPTYNSSTPSLTNSSSTLNTNSPCPLSGEEELSVDENCRNSNFLITLQRGVIKIKKSGNFQVKLYNASGKLLNSLKGKDEITLNLPKGIYFVEILTREGKLRQKVLIR